ncbi:MAG: hypothetical protein KDA22_13410, partial [Phycisphaerales bacterium]|nr:hypothetical protein [Phycisphaerales bacterium]
MALSLLDVMRHRPLLTATVTLALVLCAACGARTPTGANGGGTGAGGTPVKFERVVIKGETFDLE